ncbi:hypothetical protein PLESTF_000239400 [Pleodorina starrii]|nr:hypothetical protein PLESTF_000239400 [Pleodorina starrii]
MERNYVGQGSYSSGTQGNMISSGRRAGMARPPSGDGGANAGFSSSGSDANQGSHVPRFGRRASPGSTPTGEGMDVEPPKYTPSTGRPSAGTIPRGAIGGGAPSAAAAGSGAAAAAAGAGGGGGGGVSSKLAGLQRLKEASTARLVSRIPSASGSRTTGDTNGYVPSAMTNSQPARALPSRTNSGGRSGGFGGGGGGSGSTAAGYGSSAGPAPSSARSASTGPAMAAAGRPPSGRSTGAGGGGGAVAGSSGYGGSSTARVPPYGGAHPSSSSAVGGGSYGRGGAGGGGGSAAGGRQTPPPPPAAAPVAAARRTAAAPPPKPQPVSRAPPPPAPPPASHHRHSDDGAGYGGGGGFSGGGGGFSGGSGFGAGGIPPGADEAVPSGPMVECATCGRSFNEQAYSKHAKVCEKVFATKRKPVNMAAKRLEGSEAVKFFDLRKGLPKSEAKPQATGAGGGPGRGGGGGASRGAAVSALDARPLPGSKVPKWKSQSEQLRMAMAANRKIADAKAKGIDIKDVKFEATPAAQDDRVQCPHCGRKFAELTAERHIPKCKDIMAKPKHLAAGGGRGAHMRR